MARVANSRASHLNAEEVSLPESVSSLTTEKTGVPSDVWTTLVPSIYGGTAENLSLSPSFLLHEFFRAAFADGYCSMTSMAAITYMLPWRVALITYHFGPRLTYWTS